jgi:nitric oxide reductase NorE protein
VQQSPSPTPLPSPPRKGRRLPGVEGFWVFIGFDSVIFAALFFSFVKDRHAHPALFEASRRTLNADLAGVNTLILLTGSWLVAVAVQAVARDDLDRVPWFLLGGLSAGLLFVASKSVEYAHELTNGISPGTNAFYTWYFTLTGIHLAHLLLGTSLLVYVWRKSRQRVYTSQHRAVLESVATFWHLVDVLWIFLFPLLYLQRY